MMKCTNGTDTNLETSTCSLRVQYIMVRRKVRHFNINLHVSTNPLRNFAALNSISKVEYRDLYFGEKTKNKKEICKEMRKKW